MRADRRAARDTLVPLAASLAALAVVVSACSPGPTPSPSAGLASPSAAAPSPSLAAVALPPDLPPLAHDGMISEGDLAHDSRSDLYRSPLGAVPAGTKVTLRIRAGAGDLTDAAIRVTDTNAGASVLVPMKVVATDRTGGAHGYDYWEASLATPPQPDLYTYSFIVKDGPATRYLEDQAPAQVYTDETNDGGTGQVYAESVDSPWQIAAYDPDFATPDWSHGAVAYQIFPDRFANGDTSNDPSPSSVPGTTGAAVYRQPTNYGQPIEQKAWTDLPEGYCRSWQGVTCTEQPQGRDYFGGDIAGITVKLDDLKAMGVTVLYLNPVFAASSNHRYDTLDYRYIDPGLGTNDEFTAFAAAAKERGIHVILDGVFNHVSSSSPYFDRLRQYDAVGACEAADSPYRGWFTFVKPDADQPSPCAPSAEGGDDTYYVGWGGYDTIPELVEGDSNVLFLGKDGAIDQWLGAGASGWRLDAMDKLSHGLVKGIRATTKEADPDSLIIGEVWGNTAPYLLGNEADTTMNYRFRSAVIGLVNGATVDSDGDIPDITPSQFADRMLNVRSQYPAAAWDSLMNLVGTHDTSRILWVLTPGEANGEAKTAPDALAKGKGKLRQIAAIQMTWPGMAAVYYGDEAGLTGADDPDDRRPYPWDSIDTELQDYYRTLGTLRGAHESLRTGDLRFLLTDDDAGTLAFGRRTNAEAAVTVVNLTDAAKTISIPVADFLPEGATLDSALYGTAPVVSGGTLAVTLPARGVDVLITRPGTDLAGPAAPAGVAASASPGGVSLTWSPVDGAASYRVLRSILPGGYAEVGGSDGPQFTDTTPRPGTTYHFVVEALDATGNVGERSADVTALPELALAGVKLDAPATLAQPLSAVDPGQPIGVLVTVDGVTGAATPAIGLRVQTGFGASGSDPAGPGWTWTDATWDAPAAGADRYVGSVRPEATGTYDVVARVSTDGGTTWAYAGRSGSPYAPGDGIALTATPGADTQAPAAPQDVLVTAISDTSLTLGWTPVDAPDLLRYEVARSTAAGGPYTPVGTTNDPAFTDDSVSKGASYWYVVTAQDTSFNTSPSSAEVATAVQSRETQVTFRVTVPADTPTDAKLFIAGDFQGWNPGKTEMTKAADGTWEITLPFTEGPGPQYKYTRGSWEAVEKDASCGEIPNRTVTVEYGTDGTQVVTDTVATWRDIAKCP